MNEKTYSKPLGKIQFETENGNLSMKITASDGTELYQGDGTVKEFTVEAPMDGAYPIVVVGKKAKGSIHIDVERVPEAVEPEGTQESEPEPEAVILTADDLVDPWLLAEDEKDNSTAVEALPGAMEFTAEKTDDGTFLYTEYKDLLLCWSQGEGETGKGGDDEAESGYPGADVVELVNLCGDTTTVYKLADGIFMDRIERRFTYNDTDTWTDEDGVEWNVAAK